MFKIEAAQRMQASKLTLPQVNKALRAAGIQDKLVRGKGYFYFVGKATDWTSSSVYVYNLDDLTIDQWVEEYRSMQKENDRDEIDKRNAQRYGRTK